MKADQARQYLANTKLFAGLDPAILDRLAERASRRTYRKGEIVFHQGDLGDSLFVVVEGLLKVFVISEDGDEMVLVTLESPDTFGELALIDGGPRSASVQALQKAVVLSVTRSALLEVAADNPSLSDALLRSVGRVVRRLTEQASDLVFLDLHGRVAKLLLGLAEREAGGEATELDLAVTQSDLARMVGGSRQSVNQILHSFARRGYLELKGKQVVIKRPDLLRHRAGL